MYSLIIHVGIQKYELSLIVYMGVLHMYHISVLPPKQHNIPLIVSRQIRIKIICTLFLSIFALFYIDNGFFINVGGGPR